MGLFEASYGRRCRLPIGWFEVREAAVSGPDTVFKPMEKVKLIWERLKTAQSRQNSYANVRRRALQFEVNNLVVLNRVGQVAYKIELPADLSPVHPIFHVFMLKKNIGDSVVVDPLESFDVQDNLSYDEVLVEILGYQ
ncbi:uncharacterized protein LOC124891426, partial [Capsicum annuum]|uniref:uncharacterized protein LOC124891426 n=1 Tax=Capsicum annuum TaxID=4072 RepID=UPI001FB0851F